MVTILPLSSFIRGALGDTPNFSSPQEEVSWLRSKGLLSPGRSAAGVIRPVRNMSPEAQMPTPAQVRARNPVVGNTFDLVSQVMTPTPPGRGIPLNTTPILGQPQLDLHDTALAANQFPLQDMGDLPADSTYPTVYPQEQGVPRGTQPTAADFMTPGRAPSSQDFGVQPAQPQQQGLFGQPSDAGMWGLIAAGLGILANNYGHYGQWQPAVGRGGLIGLDTFLQQRQIQERQRIAQAEEARRAKQTQINRQLMEGQLGALQRAENVQQQKDELITAFRAAKTPEERSRIALDLAMLSDADAAFKAMASKDKWQLDWEPIAGNKERRVRVNLDTGEVQPIGNETRPIFNPNPLVQVTPQLVGERAYSAKQGGNLAEQMDTLQKAAIQATKDIGRFDQLSSLLGEIDTGKYKGTTTGLKAAAKAVGFDLEAIGIKDDVAPAQAAIALSRQMALELRNPQTGAGMPGNLSNADREFLVTMTATVENDPKAWPILIKSFKQLRQRDQMWAKMAREYAKNHDGQLDYGFIDEVEKYANENPLFLNKGSKVEDDLKAIEEEIAKRKLK